MTKKFEVGKVYRYRVGRTPEVRAVFSTDKKLPQLRRARRPPTFFGGCVMLAAWTRILPYFIVVWLAKRTAERLSVPLDNWASCQPFMNEIISWRQQP